MTGVISFVLILGAVAALAIGLYYGFRAIKLI
jgi:hypothetical protein